MNHLSTGPMYEVSREPSPSSHELTSNCLLGILRDDFADVLLLVLRPHFWSALHCPDSNSLGWGSDFPLSSGAGLTHPFARTFGKSCLRPLARQ